MKETICKTEAVLRVLVADKLPIINEWLADLLSSGNEMVLVGRTQRSMDLLAMVEATEPHVLLLDLDLAGHCASGLLRLVKMSRPFLTVIVLADYPSRSVRSQCLNAGASHVFTKTVELETVASTLKELAAKVSGQEGNDEPS